MRQRVPAIQTTHKMARPTLHTNTHAHTCTHAHKYTHTHIRAFTHVRARTHAHARTHPPTPTHTSHTHTHTHTHTSQLSTEILYIRRWRGLAAVSVSNKYLIPPERGCWWLVRTIRIRITADRSIQFTSMHIWHREWSWMLNYYWSLLYSAVLRCWADSLRSHVILHEWLAFFYSAFFNIHWSGVLTVLAWLVPHESAAVSARSVYTIQPCTSSYWRNTECLSEDGYKVCAWLKNGEILILWFVETGIIAMNELMN